MTAYIDLEELFSVLDIRSPSDLQRDRGERCLDSAAFEIDNYVFGTATAGSLSFGTPYPPLVVEVCLERAVEHWGQAGVPFGLIRQAGDIPVFVRDDTFARHAKKLSYIGHAPGIA